MPIIEKEEIVDFLICMVQQEPVIFDKTLPEYVQTDVKIEKFEIISQAIFQIFQQHYSASELMAKWNSLKSKFVEEHKKIYIPSGSKAQSSKESTWSWYNALLFLIPHVQHGSTISSITNEKRCTPSTLNDNGPPTFKKSKRNDDCSLKEIVANQDAIDLISLLRRSDKRIAAGLLSIQQYLKILLEYLAMDDSEEACQMKFALRYAFLNEKHYYKNIAVGLYHHPLENHDAFYISIENDTKVKLIECNDNVTPADYIKHIKKIILESIQENIETQFPIICIHEELNFLTSSIDVTEFYNNRDCVYRILWPTKIHITNNFLENFYKTFEVSDNLKFENNLNAFANCNVRLRGTNQISLKYFKNAVDNIINDQLADDDSLEELLGPDIIID